MNTWKIILILVIVSIPSTLLATDWNDCNSGLSSVVADATTTENVASELSRLQEEMDRLQNEHKTCLEDPEVYDTFQDGCKSKLDAYNSMVDEYNAKLPEFKTELYKMVDSFKASLPRCGY